MKLTLEIEETPREDDLKAVEDGLVDHARQNHIEPRDHRRLAIFLRDEHGQVVGGLVGATVWGWLHVKELWVAEDHRGMGQGARLTRTAEKEALRRGCHHALLDTFDFQARAFYEHLGYAIFGVLEEFPIGHRRLFMKKVLTNDDGQTEEQ